MRKTDCAVYILSAFIAGIFVGLILAYAYAACQAEHKANCQACTTYLQ